MPEATATFSGEIRAGDPHALVGDATRARTAGLKAVTSTGNGHRRNHGVDLRNSQTRGPR